MKQIDVLKECVCFSHEEDVGEENDAEEEDAQKTAKMQAAFNMMGYALDTEG